MAYKTLGQSNPAANTNTDLYTVPANLSTVVSTLVVCNQGIGPATYSVAVRPAGAAGAPPTAAQYLVYNAPVQPNDSIFLTIGLALAAGTIVTVYASSTTMSFNMFGNES